MRWHLSLFVFCASLACSPEAEPKVETKREVHTQPANSGSEAPMKEEEGDEQSFHDGMIALCESYEKAPKSDSPVESQKLLHAWLEEHVTNEKVREVFSLIGKMPPRQRSGMLRAAAAKVGLTSCALAGPDPIGSVGNAAPL